MYNKQVFSNVDPIKDWKQKMQTKYPNCAFYNHEVNSRFDIGSGYQDEQLVTESIITDGTISIQRKNFIRPTIVWANHVITLDNGTCITIEVSNATYMVDIIKKNGETQYDIHSVENDQKLLTRILDLLFETHAGSSITSSITFTSPSILLLQAMTRGQRSNTRIDLNASEPKERYLKQRGRRH